MRQLQSDTLCMVLPRRESIAFEYLLSTGAIHFSEYNSAKS